MPGFVQSASGSSATDTVTVTLPGPAGAGHGLVVVGSAVQGSGTAGTITGVTLGGAADNFAVLYDPSGQTHAHTAAWGDPDCAGGSTQVVVTFSDTGSPNGNFAYVIEFDDLPATLGAWLDKSVLGDSTGGFISTFSSGATGATTQASEHWIGCAGGHANATSGAAFGGPSSPWTNLPSLTEPGGSLTCVGIAGWQSVSATGTVTYSGTCAVNSTSDVIAIALKRVSGTLQTAAAAAAVTPALAAAAVRTGPAQAALGVAPQLAAAATHTAVAGAALAVAPQLRAAARKQGSRAGSGWPFDAVTDFILREVP